MLRSIFSREFLMGKLSNNLSKCVRRFLPRIPWYSQKRYLKDAEIRSLIVKTCRRCGFPKLGEKIPVSFNKRYTSSFGAAWGEEVEFSGPLWGLATADQRRQVIIHETCHVLTDKKHGGALHPHGKEWKAMMLLAGAEPLTCHEVDITDLYKPQKRYTIRCQSCSTKISITQNKRTRIKNGKVYPCEKCEGPITAADLKATK